MNFELLASFVIENFLSFETPPPIS